MTATPIPRTLAMTLYGDLDVSIIDELPPGRKPINTQHVFSDRISGVYSFIEKQLREGRQAYVVYPLITESEKIDLKNLEEGYATLCNVFCDYKIGKLHGKMKPAEKDAVMHRFAAGEILILVSTTVIEVCVNVPTATLMVVENAEYFGLSQLHQLRGRVGRGKDKSWCILVSDNKGETAKQRLEIMCKTNNGYEIAEKDLELRGPGDFFAANPDGVSWEVRQ
jgi:ATP-dependent DNA helicase RecG